MEIRMGRWSELRVVMVCQEREGAVKKSIEVRRVLCQARGVGGEVDVDEISGGAVKQTGSAKQGGGH